MIQTGEIFMTTNAFLKLMNHGPDTDKMYLYAKDPYKAKYQILINKG